MKIVRYILFCILVLIISIFLRRPADMPKGRGGFGDWAIVEWVTSFFSGGGVSDTDVGDEDASDEDGSDDEEDDEE